MENVQAGEPGSARLYGNMPASLLFDCPAPSRYNPVAGSAFGRGRAGQMGHVFISHVEEDGAPALELRAALEAAGYRTWCYECDTVPGCSYLLQTGSAIDQADAVILVISEHSLSSHQVTAEVVRAHESSTPIVPLLLDVSHSLFQRRQPEWRQAIGAAASLPLDREDVHGSLDRILCGLRALGVTQAGASDSAPHDRRVAVQEAAALSRAHSEEDAGTRAPRAPAPAQLAVPAAVAQGAVSIDAEEAARRQREAAAELGVPVERTLDLGSGVTMSLVLIPAGEFTMGSPPGEEQRAKNEGPQHRVRITQPFYMGKHQVTQEQFEAVTGANPSCFTDPQNPVERVSWNDAGEFCRKLSSRTRTELRLPTEAEWEYACRAGSTTRFHFGDGDGQLSEYGWYRGNSGSKTHPVGQKTPNAWGLCDMHGNVWEWCGDWYSGYGSGTASDPKGPTSGKHRVLRGGSWGNDPRYCRSADRYGSDPTGAGNGDGFRVVVSPRPSAQARSSTQAPAAQAAATPVAAEEAARRQREAAAELGVPVERTLDLGSGVTMSLVLIPAGEFTMGSPPQEWGRWPNEGPQHAVQITKPFYMGKCQVTQEQYKAVTGANPSHFKGPKNPVEMVSWNDAAEFCRKLAERTGQEVRLPIEAEREHACRSGSTTRFHFGDRDDQLGEYAWYKGNSSQKTHPVGQKRPNAWGLYDMHGNVWQWCLDWYGGYGSETASDPEGPASGEYRVLRGGSWLSVLRGCRSADRYRASPSLTGSGVGFRVVVSPRPSAEALRPVSARGGAD